MIGLVGIAGRDLNINPRTAYRFPVGEITIGFFQYIDGVLHGQDFFDNFVIDEEGHFDFSLLNPVWGNDTGSLDRCEGDEPRFKVWVPKGEQPVYRLR